MQILSKISQEEFGSIMGRTPKSIIDEIKESGLTGRGGAGFPTGLKWELTRQTKGKRVLICNADEGEPGTFKDRFIMENNPTTLLQGIAIGGHALNAECFIYLRGEYSYLRPKMERMIKKMGFDIKIVTGAGAYVCGEETSLLESVEGKRGAPRPKPPYPTVEGLWKRPTCINNVETLANIPLLLTKEGWDVNRRLFSISGNVNAPGVYELPLGMRLKDVLSRSDPKKIKTVCFGYSGGIAPFERFKNVRFYPETLIRRSLVLGSCALIAVGRKSIVKVVKNIAEFFMHESCGKCIPCREGGFRMLELIKKIDVGMATQKELKELKDLAEYIDISFCALGKGYGFTVSSAIKNFKKEFDEKCR